MQEHLFDHVDIIASNTHVPSGTVARDEVQTFCEQYERRIKEVGGIAIGLDAGTSQALKRQIDTGFLGDIYHARSWMLRRAGMIPLRTFTSKALAGGGLVGEGLEGDRREELLADVFHGHGRAVDAEEQPKGA